VLVEALRQYAGTFVVVSHDRHFLDQVATSVWWVGGGDVRIFQGTYSDYLWQREQKGEPGGDGQAASAPSPAPEPDGKPSGGRKTKEQKRREAEERNRLYRQMQKGKAPADIEDPTLLARLVERLENEVAVKEEEKAALEAKIADTSFYMKDDDVSD